jgi:hypothetical protein
MQSVAILLSLFFIVGVILWRHDKSLVNEEKRFNSPRSNCKVYNYEEEEQ